MSRRRCSPATAPPLEDEDLLQEILLRLPPQPSSLPRASTVCKRWLNILSDPQFVQRFRKHHGKPPLIGFFSQRYGVFCDFKPVLELPDRIHAHRFSMPKSRSSMEQWRFMGCRNGLTALINECRREAVVWDPLTGRQHHMPFQPGLQNALTGSFCVWHASVLCADAEHGHGHGDCILGPFKLVLICNGYKQTFGSIYDSSSGSWGNIFSRRANEIYARRGNILVGNVLCWLICGGDVLVFDIKTQSLGVIEKPADNHVTIDLFFQLLRMEKGGLGLAVLSEQIIQLWERKPNCDGVVGWVLLQKAIPLKGLLPSRKPLVLIVGYDEDTNATVLSTGIGNFMLQLDSVQIKHIIKRNNMCIDMFYPYHNFYTAGNTSLSTLHNQNSPLFCFAGIQYC
ncbi:LOW QUALITY PROTEIN: hypothetical protein CFC21_055972 [Triticum aestivum]|uniref:F-box domain-containing protein n=2 Tax=Triticum aestivum TaxID=4565 RepID=A0A9R1KAL9_WHEAT|nr:LOW QUALITY PROTEIN: hypothetical protein CFC21_055972 [Triticum aestivum]